MDIKEHAVGQEGYTFFEQFNTDQLDEIKEEIAKLSIELDDVKTEKAEAIKKFNDRMKNINEPLQKLLEKFRDKGEHKTVTAYLVDNQDEGIMEYFTEDGVLLHTRPLRLSERQMRLSLVSGEES